MTAVLVAGAVLAVWVLAAAAYLTLGWAAARRMPPMPRQEDYYCLTCAEELGRVRGPHVGRTFEEAQLHVMLAHFPAPIDVVDR